jgi:hypothetical protein
MTTQLAVQQVPGSLDELSNLDQDALFRLTGQAADLAQGNMLPKLGINYQAQYVDEDVEDFDPISLPLGSYYIRVQPDEGMSVTAYCKRPLFRPFIQGFRYSVYDQTENTSLLNTNIFKGWGDVVVTDKGHEFVAKHFKRSILKIHPEYASDPARLKCSRVTYGTVTMEDAKDMHGADVEIVDVPCMWYTKGSSFMPVGDIIKEMVQTRKPLFTGELKLDNTREKMGTVTYWVADKTKWVKKDLPIDEATVKLLQDFNTTIEEENKELWGKYKAELAKKQNDTFAEDFSSGSLADDLDDAIDDLG